MAERSKALRSGRSLVLQAWVRIPLLTRTFYKHRLSLPSAPVVATVQLLRVACNEGPFHLSCYIYQGVIVSTAGFEPTVLDNGYRQSWPSG